MRAFLSVMILSAAMSPGSAHARQSDQSATQVPVLDVLRTTSRLVQMNVLVHDPKGAPVLRLTKEDFTVLDQGRPVRIATFRAVEEQQTTLAAATPSLTLNNQNLARSELPASATVILIDSLNMGDPEELLYVKRELPKFLKNLHEGDPVAIYSLAGPTVTVVHEFSDNTESLIRASDRGHGVLSQWLGSASVKTSKFADQHVKAEWTLSALESIALHLAHIPGRKTLVWVSTAFPITLGFIHMASLTDGTAIPSKGVSTYNAHAGDMLSYYERLKRLARIMNNVDVAVYPVDPRGLAIESQYKVSQSTAPAAGPGWMETKGEDTAGEFATMDMMAAETGGRAFYNANALGQSVQMAVDDSRLTYVLGFYPDDATWDGKSHELEVKVDRPGVQVRSRRSYFASDAPIESPSEREAALQVAAATPLNATAVGVTVRVLSNPLQPGLQQIDVSVNPHDIRFEEKDGKWRADFDLIVTQQAPDGRRVAGERNQCLVDRATSDEARRKELTFRREVLVEQDAASLRVLVRDSVSGEVGSLQVPIAAEGIAKVKPK